ncbi:MAG TPA: DNA repair protein RecN [Acidimicrobiales bacterium]
MLTELVIHDLGIIHDCHLLLGPGMTAVTGETGAGKTMVVEAIDLLVGGRAEGHVVRSGASEAVVEGRFLLGDEEHVVRRVVPRDGRSRCYLDGRLATVSALAELGEQLVDLHGQHAHQSLLSPSVQRAALDRYGAVPVGELTEARAELAAIEAALADLGGAERARAREIDLYRFQVDELRRAAISDPDEDERLDAEEDTLADASAHRTAGAAAADAITGEGGALDAIAAALGALDARAPFAEAAQRLKSASVELADVASELRAVADAIDEDPARLDEIRARRQLLRELRRKYGATLADVLAYQAEAEARLVELLGHDQRAAELDARRARALERLAAVQAKVRAAREAVAPKLAKAVQRHLAELAMPKARLGVQVDGPAGDDVRLLLAANPGGELLPLTKVASGGELARAMLALRLVLTAGPPTLVFDEVDAGIGGEAAIAVGRSLAALGATHQVLVVTHLPQVAAFADHHIGVRKVVRGDTTYAEAAPADGDDRVVELSRMLSGTPDSEIAREHAAELLATASKARAQSRRRSH